MTTGSYFVLLPDGRIQRVTYTVDGQVCNEFNDDVYKKLDRFIKKTFFNLKKTV